MAATGALSGAVSSLQEVVVGSGGVTSQLVHKVIATRSDGRKVFGAIGLAATAPNDATGGQSEIILAASRLLFVPESDPNASPVAGMELGLVDGVTTLRVPRAVIGDLTIGTGKLDNNATSKLIGTTVTFWTVAQVTVVITAADIPAGSSTVPVLIVASADTTSPAYFDLSVNPSGWVAPGNLIASLPPAGCPAACYIANLGVGTHVIAAFNHGSSTPQYDGTTKVRTVAALVAKK